MEEETDEYNPFVEESKNDEPINNVSVCVYYDSSRIFSLIIFIGAADKATQVASWARKSKGLITIFYVVYQNHILFLLVEVKERWKHQVTG